MDFVLVVSFEPRCRKGFEELNELCTGPGLEATRGRGRSDVSLPRCLLPRCGPTCGDKQDHYGPLGPVKRRLKRVEII